MHEVASAHSGSLQQRLQVVADSGTLAIWEADLDTGEIVWSTQGYHLLGIPPEDGARTMHELLARLHPEDRPRALAAIEDAVAAGVPHRRDRFRIVQPDGTIRYIAVHANFIAGPDRKAHRMIALAIDVTDLAEKENRLVETEERLRTAYAAAKVWTCRLDLEHWVITRPLQPDDTGTPQFGPEQTFIDWLERVHPEDRPRVESGMRRAIETGELWEDEFRLLWPDGRYHWIYDRGRRIHDPGQVPVFAGAAMDIDERKLVEQQLIENEERLRSAYVAGKMWPWEIEVGSGQILRSDNMGLYRGPGHAESIAVSAWLDYVHPDDRDRVHAAIQRAFEGEGQYSCDYRLRWNDNTYHWVSSRGGLIQDGRGSWKLMGIGRDITDEKATEHALQESERLRLLAIEGAQMGVFFQEISSGKVRWSDRQFELFGMSREHFADHRDDFRRLVLPEDLVTIDREYDRLTSNHARRFRFEFRIRRPSDGKVRWINSVGEFNYDESGTPISMMGVNSDVTDQKAHEQEVWEIQKLRSIALSAAEMGVWQQDLTTGKITWTEREFELFEVRPEEFDGTPVTAFRHIVPEDRERFYREWEYLVANHEPRHVTEFRIQLPDGAIRWVAAVGELVYNEHGEAIQSIGVNFDITSRKHQEEALRESERLRRLSLSAAHMGAFEWNVVNGDISWSPEQYELLNFDPVSTKPTLELFENRVHPDDLPRIRDLMSRLIAKQEKAYRAEFRIIWPDGTTRWIRTLGELVYDDAGQVIRLFGVNWDISDQKEAEQQIVQLNRELQRKVADFEALMHAMPVAVAVGLDAESSDIRVNPTFAQMLGVKDGAQNLSSSSPGARSLPYRFLREGVEIPPNELPQQKAARLKQEIRNEEFELVTDDRHIDMFGHAVPMLDESGNVRGTLAAYMDITERKRAEKALRTSEKLATAGKMAASLAHEINNPLAAVTNLLYLVAQDASLSPHSQKFINMATSELARVSQITRNILAFYRESHSPIHVDIGELVASVLELYTPKIRHSNVEVDFRRNGACSIVAFPGELRQVFSNLIVNAVDAMPKGGKLHIRVRPAQNRRSQQSGVRLVVADSGSGIPRDHLTHLFEPFFTTKGEKGTGLGLWVSRDIISKHDGTVHIRTASGAQKSGTCFSIFLPAESASVRKRAGKKAASTNA
ncbi:MAG: PAS domain-containing protein [Terriglobia bacterium]|nr:PAS domain-containing protein [Terriglobia bacterium]